MAGLVPETAVMLTQHGCARAQLKSDLSCLLSLYATLQILPKSWALIDTMVQSVIRSMRHTRAHLCADGALHGLELMPGLGVLSENRSIGWVERSDGCVSGVARVKRWCEMETS